MTQQIIDALFIQLAVKVNQLVAESVAEERETCAKLAHDRGVWWYHNKPEAPESKDNSEDWFKFHEGNHKMLMSYEIAAAIRARKS